MKIPLRIIPPKHYNGLLPKGFKKSDFIRFEKHQDYTFAVLKNNGKVLCD